jgi:hypothetical protein
MSRKIRHGNATANVDDSGIEWDWMADDIPEPMAQRHAREIKELVDSQGWDAVHKHPYLGPAWRKSVRESQALADSLDQ